jgi:putative inorganic carbon (HCO3(-)) transporter
VLPKAESIQIVLPIVSILFLIFTFKRSVYGTISYFIILNAKLGDMYPVLGAIRFELIAAIIVLASIFFAGKGILNLSTQVSKINTAFWILVALGMLSVPQAVDIAESWEQGGYNLLKMALFYVMVVASIQDFNDLTKMTWAFVLITGWIAYEPVTNYMRGIAGEQTYGEIGYGSYGVATGHVALANTLSQGLPLAFFWAMSEKNAFKKGLLWAIVSLLTLGIIFSKSRGGFIGLVSVGLCYIYFSERRMKATFTGQEYMSRISTIAQGASGRSSSDRIEGLVNGISMLMKRPLLGVGVGCYARARSIYFNYYFYSHNLYGELLGELGLASAAWFFWIYLMFRISNRLKTYLNEENEQHQFYRSILTGVQSGLFVRLVLGNFSHCAFIWFWFMMGALVVGIEHLITQEMEENELIESDQEEAKLSVESSG